MIQGFLSYFLPDLIVNLCPLGCDGKCVKIWNNQKIHHRIICICTKCHGKRELDEAHTTFASAPGEDACISKRDGLGRCRATKEGQIN